MKKLAIATMAAALTLFGLSTPQPVYALCDSCVVARLTLLDTSLATQLTALNTSMSQLLYNVGVSTNQNGTKLAATMEEAARLQRDFSVVQKKNRMLEEARQRYIVPSTVCAESMSGVATQIAASTASMKSSVRPGGGGISNAAIAQAINSPAPSPEVDASRATKVHSQFCDADDFAAYGGSKACPSVSTSMPGADKRVDSILTGAGPNGKAPDLTFSQAQADAARMYVQNSVRRTIARAPGKGEADTTSGAQYVGLLTQYNSVISAAADPQEKRLAESLPNLATKGLIQEAMQSRAAALYYQQTASRQAKSSGMMSSREFEAFETGRRYANTEYQADLQALTGDNLAREQVRVQALNAWLTLKLKEEIERGNILQGQILASLARQEYEPLLRDKSRMIAGRLGGAQ